MGLIIRSSAIHAAGCYTTSPIASGTRVVEYTGPLIDKEEADRRYADKPITYLFAIGDGTQVIDGHGTAMFINHSCDANCETEEVDGHVWIAAIRDIAAGEEICYDYCLFDGDEADAPCNCGARTCRSSMFSPEELQRRKRLAQKQPAKKAKKTEIKERAAPKKQRTSAGKKLRRTVREALSSRTETKISLSMRLGKTAREKKKASKTPRRKSGRKTLPRKSR